MPTEAEVDDLLTLLPESSFTRCFVGYTRTITDCPSIFMMHAAMQAMLAAAPEGMGIQLGVVQAPNTFTLLVGSSASSRKTTAINWATRMATDTNAPEYLLVDVSSPEGFVRKLGENRRRLVIITEGGDWLNRTRPGAYQNVMRDNLVRLYDGQPVGHAVKDSKKSLKEVKDHHVSVFMGCTLSHLEDYTQRVDFEGGLMNRFMIVTGDREREYLKPSADPAGEAWLIHALGQRINDFKHHHGVMRDMDPGAKKLWLDWNRELRARNANLNEGQRTAIARSTTHAIKVMQIMALDTGLALESDWSMSANVMEFAIRTVNWSIAAMLEVYDCIAGSKYEKQRRSVLTVMEDYEAKSEYAVDYSAIANNIRPKMLMRELRDVLNSMLSEGTLQLWKTPGMQDRFSRYEAPNAGASDEDE